MTTPVHHHWTRPPQASPAGPTPAAALRGRLDGNDAAREGLERGSMVTVLVAQRGHLLRGALVHMLEAEDDVEVVAETGDGAALPALIDRHRPAVTVLDGALPRADELIASLYETLVTSRLLILVHG